MQYFEWNLIEDGKHWQRLRDDAVHLAELGVSGVWIPPCTKAITSNDVCYAAYDLYDLGEFDQKGCRQTKYGTKQELQESIQVLHKNNLKVYADVVLNHKAGADETERFQVVMVAPQDRELNVS
ncbi:MAG TPA: alpha-amylase family glycosyl hydrolase [Ruminiclostridium sp.]